ncbi:MAG: hypothetical protein B7Y74_05665 [Novosphingobium sp. 35-62-5]|nr:MAG: hypothetical protein B7Y74_05665 [Novosphingobium sp. 35-62-5]
MDMPDAAHQAVTAECTADLRRPPPWLRFISRNRSSVLASEASSLSVRVWRLSSFRGAKSMMHNDPNANPPLSRIGAPA